MNSADLETRERHEAIWREFVQRPQVTVFPGRLSIPPAVNAMLGFQVPVADPGVRASLAGALRGWQESGCLSPFPEDYWHITIVPPALLTGGRPSPPHLLGEAFAEEALAGARAAVREYGGFDVIVRGVNAFRDVVVAVPYDGGHIAELNRRLRNALPHLPERYLDGHDPLSHISLALYKSSEGLGRLAAALTASREEEFGSFRVSAIEMYLLPVADGVLGSPRKHPIPLE